MTIEDKKTWIETNRKMWMDDYFKLLSFPSISADPQYTEALLECEQWLESAFKNLGFHIEQWKTATGHPVLFASYAEAGSNQPTLLIYNHYDVQPVDPLEEWKSPPFTPTLRDGQVYARGAQDNKGQLFYVWQSLKLLIDKTGKLPINIKLCIEGEEEMGSASLTHLLIERKESLKADYLAIVDLGMRHLQTPCLTLGIRGILTLDLDLEGPTCDLHSGCHGGMVVNPNQALVTLLASLHHPNGEIAIPGFYDDVVTLTAEERADISFQVDVDAYEKEVGTPAVGGEKDYLLLERAWLRPTLEINGIAGGYAGKGFKTVIPAKAHAKISCRLVPNQDPDHIGKLVAAYLTKQAPEGVKVKVTVHPGKGKPMRVSPHSTVVKAFADAFQEVFGVPCEYIMEGASIPITAELAAASGGETILLGLGLISDQIHAPNEHFSIDRIEKGILVMAQAIENLTIQG